MTVKLLDLDGNVVATMTMDSSGNYKFDNAPVRDCKIMGVAPDGTELTIQDVDGNSRDAVDSDVDENGMYGIIAVEAHSNSDIDLGLCEKKPEPGSLSGRYFCDDDHDGLDNDGPTGSASVGIPSVVVTLPDQFGNPATDFDGNPVAQKLTDSNGNYSFGNLAAGSYSVQFTDAVSGKLLTAQNVDGNVSDDIDSDAGGVGTAGGVSQIDGIVVVAAANTPDNDAGVYPVADDMGKGCADGDILVDFSNNYLGAQNGAAITMIDGQAITAGGGSIRCRRSRGHVDGG